MDKIGVYQMWNDIILQGKMQRRIEQANIHKHDQPMYLDSAYKALMRAERLAEALNNRNKVLQMNQQKMQRQCQNHQNQLQRIENIRSHHRKDTKQVERARKRQEFAKEEQLKENQEQRLEHQRQMSNVSMGLSMEKERVREEIQKLRSLHQQTIQSNRDAEWQQKKSMRDQIQQSIAVSRVTLKNFYDSKHSRLVEGKQEEVRQLNKRRMEYFDHASLVQRQQLRNEQLMKIKGDLNKSASTPQMKSPYQSTKSDSHPLVRRIDGVMDRFAKYL